MRILGIILMVLGIAVFVIPSISFKDEETVFEMGPLKATAERERHFPLPPVLGGLLFAGGVVIVVVTIMKDRKTSHG